MVFRVKALPKNSAGRNPIQSIQVALGSTGDVGPWHGVPVERQLYIVLEMKIRMVEMGDSSIEHDFV